MGHQGVMNRAALGSMAYIGDLYDARTDNFCGLPIFDKEIPPSALRVTDADFSDIHLVHSDTFSEKFSKMDVKANLQVSVLAGMFKLEGSAHYLADQKRSARTVKSSLLYKIKTKDESLNIYNRDLREAYSTHAIEAGQATHVVTGISWGGNCVLSCFYENRDNRDVTQVEGSLSAQMKRVSLSISGKASVDLDEGDLNKGLQFEVRIFGDILPKGGDLPTTFEGALNLMKQLPSLVETTNGGKGKPLSYELLPISLIKSYLELSGKGVEPILKTLEEATMERVVQLFDEMLGAQQQMNDFYEDSTHHKYCLLEEELAKIVKLKGELAVAETKLRSKLSSTLTEVRSGRAEVSEVEDLILEFQSSPASPEKVQASLREWAVLQKKIKFAKTVVDNGAEYIGWGASLDEELLSNFDSKVFLLYFTQQAKVEDLPRWKMNRQIFFQEMKMREDGTKCFAVDCDIHPDLLPLHGSSSVQLMQAGNVVVEDVLEDLEKTAQIPLAEAISGTERTVEKPNKRTALLLPCTGINCDPAQEYDWICKKCSDPLEYGFDQAVYCACGTTPITLLVFKCPDPKHGLVFEQHEGTYLQELVGRLRVFPEMNIVLLGEIGVGKSTWISAFANYLKYDSLEEMEEGELETFVPSGFEGITEEGDEVTVRTGEEDPNEVGEPGRTTTRHPKVYPFQIGNLTIRLIDTPGFGDDREEPYETINLQKTVRALAQLDEIHGICIFLDPTLARPELMLKYCIKELLKNFPPEANKNIMFCFTHAQKSSFQAGDTLAALRSLRKQHSDLGLTVSSQTVYYYDSEAYRYLAGLKNNPQLHFEQAERKKFAESWTKSKLEIDRMRKHIRNLIPYPVVGTILEDWNRDLAHISTVTELIVRVVVVYEIMNDKELEEKVQDGSSTDEELWRRDELQKMKCETEELIGASVLLNQFVKINTPAPYQDPSELHMKKLMEWLGQSPSQVEWEMADEARFRILKKIREQFSEQHSRFESGMRVIPSIEGVRTQIETLKGLEYNGEEIKEALDNADDPE